MSEPLLLILALGLCGGVGLTAVALVGYLFWQQQRTPRRERPSPRRVTRLKPPAQSPAPDTIAVLSADEHASRTIVAAPAAERTYTLTALTGPYTGQTYSLVQFPARIGRAVGCTIVLEADGSVSRQQAEFYKVGPILRLRDLHSSHGTLVNGRVIEDVELHGDEQIQVGNTTLALAHAD